MQIKWCYWIGKRNDTYGIIEIYYWKRKRYKLKSIKWTTDFFHVWKSKREVIKDLKRILEEWKAKNQDKFTLNNTKYSYFKKDIGLMIHDSSSIKRPIIDMELFD